MVRSDPIARAAIEETVPAFKSRQSIEGPQAVYQRATPSDIEWAAAILDDAGLNDVSHWLRESLRA